MTELNDSPKEAHESKGIDVFTRENLLSQKLPEVAVSNSTLALLSTLELDIQFAKADSPDSIKDLGKAIDALSKTKTANGLTIKQKEDGSFNLDGGGVYCSIRPNGDIVSYGNKPNAKVEGKASIDENGNIVLKDGDSTHTISKDGTVVTTTKTDYGYDEDVPVKYTAPGHGKFKETEYDLKDKTIHEIAFKQVPEGTVKVGDKGTVEFKPKDGSITISDGTTTWTSEPNGDLVITKDGKKQTLKALDDAKFKESGLRCGGGTYTFPDGTEIFYKNGHITSVVVKTDNGSTIKEIFSNVVF